MKKIFTLQPVSFKDRVSSRKFMAFLITLATLISGLAFSSLTSLSADMYTSFGMLVLAAFGTYCGGNVWAKYAEKKTPQDEKESPTSKTCPQCGQKVEETNGNS